MKFCLVIVRYYSLIGSGIAVEVTPGVNSSRQFQPLKVEQEVVRSR